MFIHAFFVYMINHSINNKVFTQFECIDIIDFCLKYGEQFSYKLSEHWDCKRIHNDEFKQNIINKLTSKFKNGEFNLWFDYSKFNLKNFNISLTSYYDGRYLNLHKDTNSELTSVIVLSDDYSGGEFALSDTDTPDINFNRMVGISTYNLKMGDMISFNGSTTYHGVLPVTNGIRYALNIWMTEANYDYPITKINNTLI